MKNKLPVALAAMLFLAAAAAPAAPTAFNYDRNNQLTRAVYADGRQVTYGYDDMGNVVSVTVANAAAPLVLVDEPIHGKINLPIADYQVVVNVPADVTAYVASGLPAGLKLNATTTTNADGKPPGVIYGTPTIGGTFTVKLTAKSALGTGPPATLFVHIANPFTTVEDGYDLVGKAFAIVPISAIPGGELGGSIALSVAANGRFSGKLTLGTKTYAFKGQFESQYGGAVVMIDRSAPLADLTLNIGLGLEGSLRGMLFGTASDGVTNVNLDGNVSVFGRSNRATAFAGAKGATYNVAVMPHGSHAGNDAFPQGAGYAFVKMTPNGDVALTGKLADGTAFSSKSILFRTGEAPVWTSLYKGNGAFTGTVEASDSGSVDLLTDNRIAGAFMWQRLAMPGTLYAAGFPTPMNTYLAGGYYVAPARGWRVMDLGNDTTAAPVRLMLFRGGLPAFITSDMTIDTRNVVTEFVPNSNEFALKFTPKSGLFSGKFTSPPPARTTTFQGIIVPAFGITPPQGYGYVLLPGATPADPVLSGQVNLQPLVLIP